MIIAVDAAIPYREEAFAEFGNLRLYSARDLKPDRYPRCRCPGRSVRHSGECIASRWKLGSLCGSCQRRGRSCRSGLSESSRHPFRLRCRVQRRFSFRVYCYGPACYRLAQKLDLEGQIACRHRRRQRGFASCQEGARTGNGGASLRSSAPGCNAVIQPIVLLMRSSTPIF